MNRKNIIVIVILMVLIVVGVYLYQTYGSSQSMLSDEQAKSLITDKLVAEGLGSVKVDKGSVESIDINLYNKTSDQASGNFTAVINTGNGIEINLLNVNVTFNKVNNKWEITKIGQS